MHVIRATVTGKAVADHFQNGQGSFLFFDTRRPELRIAIFSQKISRRSFTSIETLPLTCEYLNHSKSSIAGAMVLFIAVSFHHRIK